MKRLIYLFTILTFVSCEKFDPVKDNAEIKETAPNAYMSPLNPTAIAGSEVIVPVQYWSVDDKFNYLGLWHKIDTSTIVQIELAPKSVGYNYEKTTEGNKREEVEYKEYQFGYDDWSPADNAYATELKYMADATFAKISVSKNVSDFVIALHQGAEDEFYTTLANDLSKSKMQLLVVSTHGVVTQVDFDTKYDAEGNYLDGAEAFFETKLKEIGIENLIGVNHKYEKIHAISLRFKIINGNNTEGVSSYRSFNDQ